MAERRGCSSSRSLGLLTACSSAGRAPARRQRVRGPPAPEPRRLPPAVPCVPVLACGQREHAPQASPAPAQASLGAHVRPGRRPAPPPPAPPTAAAPPPTGDGRARPLRHPAACGSRFGPADGAAGSVYYPLLFTNVSGATCTLYGYPGAAPGEAGRRERGRKCRDRGTPAFTGELVTLAPARGRAHFPAGGGGRELPGGRLQAGDGALAPGVPAGSGHRAVRGVHGADVHRLSPLGLNARNLRGQAGRNRPVTATQPPRPNNPGGGGCVVQVIDRSPAAGGEAP